MTEDESKALAPGIYRITWADDHGTSIAAIGHNLDGVRWVAPVNWKTPWEGAFWWSQVERAELLLCADGEQAPGWHPVPFERRDSAWTTAIEFLGDELASMREQTETWSARAVCAEIAGEIVIGKCQELAANLKEVQAERDQQIGRLDEIIRQLRRTRDALVEDRCTPARTTSA